MSETAGERHHRWYPELEIFGHPFIRRDLADDLREALSRFNLDCKAHGAQCKRKDPGPCYGCFARWAAEEYDGRGRNQAL